MFSTNDELKLEQIDFKWVEKTDEAKQLKKAIKLLRDDGGFFPELEKACEEKLKNLDKKFKVIAESKQNVSKDELERQKADILNWEASINQKEKLINYSSNFQKTNKTDENLTKILEEKEAENEKFKGNELMKTKEFEDAIKHYKNSIRLNPNEPTTYCNRALAYLKIKKFENALEDCEMAIKLKDNYSKAYYRRALCFLNIKELKKAWNDLIFILKETPTSEEIISEITNLREKWKTQLGNEEYSKIEAILNEEFEEARNYKKSDEPIINKNEIGKNKFIENIPQKIKIEEKPLIADLKSETDKKGFKKIQILEEEIQEENKEIPEMDIDQELKKNFEIFMQSGYEVKGKLKELISQNKKKEADEIARNCLKDCQNFIKLFKPNTKYHSDIENSINELSNLLNSLNEKIQTDQKKYFKTKIFSEELRENATKIAEEDFKFDDIPKTAYGFEKAFNSFKKRLDVYFSYLKYVGYKKIPDLYKNNEISYNLLNGLIQCLKNHGLENSKDIETSIGILTAISKTKNFHLVKKFLKKSDKEDLRAIFEKIKSNDESITVFNESNLEKIYF